MIGIQTQVNKDISHGTKVQCSIMIKILNFESVSYGFKLPLAHYFSILGKLHNSVSLNCFSVSSGKGKPSRVQKIKLNCIYKIYMHSN